MTLSVAFSPGLHSLPRFVYPFTWSKHGIYAEEKKKNNKQ